MAVMGNPVYGGEWLTEAFYGEGSGIGTRGGHMHQLFFVEWQVLG